MRLNWVDWMFILGYGVFSLVVGIYYSKRAGKNISEFFVGGRKISWFIAGTSLVATTFASDTPLVISGLVRKGGIFENWLWWSGVMGSVMTVFFFARLWRRSGILTDNEFNELRYTGRPAAILRGFNAVYGALITNCVIMGWVILAMTKITEVLLGWDKVLSVGVLLVVTLGYTVLSGYWGVVMTDCVQFFIAMGGSILLAVMVVFKMGGPASMIHQIQAAPGYHPEILNMVPKFTFEGVGKLAFITFLIQISLQWWGGGAGGGYIAQRFFSVKTEKDAALAALWFNFAQFVLRSWPWIIVGLASVAVFPLKPGQDHEAIYPKMIIEFLPMGLRGLMAASLFAAFMSTVTSQLNWGASYLINDLYRRFIHKTASDHHYVNASRVATVLIMALGAIAAWQFNNIAHVWVYLMTLTAGAGFVALLRWYWWRVNAWAEIAAMASSLVFANLNIICKPLHKIGLLSHGTMADIDKLFSADFYAIRFAFIIIICTIIWVLVAYLTKPVPDEQLTVFFRRVRPGGWWGHIAKNNPDIKRDDMRKAWAGWFFGVISTFTGLFGVGLVCLGQIHKGIIHLIVCALTTWLMFTQLPSDELPEVDPYCTSIQEETAEVT